MDNADLIEQYDAKLSGLLTHMHNDGLSLEVIILILDQKVGNLKTIEYSSTYLTCNVHERLKKALEIPTAIS